MLEMVLFHHHSSIYDHYLNIVQLYGTLMAQLNSRSLRAFSVERSNGSMANNL